MGEPGSEIRDAGRRLLQYLAPRERAAVLLKDVFDLDLEESAEVLETMVGAVKAALRPGRSGPLELVQRRRDQPRTRASGRMAERDRASVVTSRRARASGTASSIASSRTSR